MADTKYPIAAELLPTGWYYRDPTATRMIWVGIFATPEEAVADASKITTTAHSVRVVHIGEISFRWLPLDRGDG